MPVTDAPRIRSINTQFLTDTALDGNALNFAELAASEEGGACTKGEHVVDPEVDTEVIEL